MISGHYKIENIRDFITKIQFHVSSISSCKIQKYTDWLIRVTNSNGIQLGITKWYSISWPLDNKVIHLLCILTTWLGTNPSKPKWSTFIHFFSKAYFLVLDEWSDQNNVKLFCAEKKEKLIVVRYQLLWRGRLSRLKTLGIVKPALKKIAFV